MSPDFTYIGTLFRPRIGLSSTHPAIRIMTRENSINCSVSMIGISSQPPPGRYKAAIN